MTIEQKYKETMEQLYYATRDLNEIQKRNESTFVVLSDLSKLISTFYTSLDTLQGQRKINALEAIKTLQSVFNEIGSSYILELYFRDKCGQYEKALIEASKEIESLKKEIEVLNQINNL